jgi:hypothetical protein
MFIMAIMAVAGLVLWVGTGCEEADGVGGLGVTPSSSTLGGSNASTQVFTAHVSSALALPLEWSVSNSGLGNIVSQSGSNAIYVANSGKKGSNVITVRDQYKNEGSAVVTQP